MNARMKFVLWILFCFISYNAHAMEQKPAIFLLIEESSPAAFFSPQNRSIADLQTLIENNPDQINAIGQLNRTPLMVAFQCKHTQAIEILLSHPDINLNAQDFYGKTALHHAAATCDFLSQGFEWVENKLGKEVLTPHKRNISKLIAKGALASIRDCDGHTALDIAYPRLRIFLAGLINQSNDRLLLQGTRHGDWRAVQLAMRDGANINTQDTRDGLAGNTPAHYAAQYVINEISRHPQANHTEQQNILNFLRLVLSYNPDLSVQNQQHITPAHVVSELPAICTLLFETPQHRKAFLTADARYRQ